MIWIGYVYLVIFALFGASALWDDLKEQRTVRFLVSLVPYATLLFATSGFLFLDPPGGYAWLVLAAIAVSLPILVWDGYQDAKNLRRDGSWNSARVVP